MTGVFYVLLFVCVCLPAYLSVLYIPLPLLCLVIPCSLFLACLYASPPPTPTPLFPVFRVVYERTRAAAIQPYSVIVLKNP